MGVIVCWRPVEVCSFSHEKTNSYAFDFNLQGKMYKDKTVKAKLIGGRVVEGTLRGFDPFLNLVVDESTEIRKDGEHVKIGCVIVRGSSIIMLEAPESLLN